jgi:hypothetical protein
MGLKISSLRRQAEEAESMGNITVDRRLWLTADRERVVEDGDPEAAFLLAALGQTISESDAERYGLVPKAKTKASAKSDKKAVEAPEGDKAAEE